MTETINPRRRALGAFALGVAGLAGAATAAEHKHGGMGGKGGEADHHAAMMARMDAVESKQAITEVLHLYARGWDRMDEETLRGCFWPDSTHAHSAFRGKSQDFIGVAFPRMQKVIGSTHMISNVVVELAGDRALSECYFQAHHRRLNAAGTDEEDYYLQGRYIDRLERRGGVWKIAHRTGLNEVERIVPRADGPLRNAPAEQRGARKPDDAFYAMRDAFRAGK